MTLSLAYLGKATSLKMLVDDLGNIQPPEANVCFATSSSSGFFDIWVSSSAAGLLQRETSIALLTFLWLQR